MNPISQRKNSGTLLCWQGDNGHVVATVGPEAGVPGDGVERRAGGWPGDGGRRAAGQPRNDCAVPLCDVLFTICA